MKKGPLETYRTPRLSRARKNTWRDAHPLPFNLSTCDFCALFQKKHHLMQRSYQKHPLLWKVVFFPIHPSKVLLETKFNNPISCHIIIFFQTTVLQFWRFLDPMLTYFLFQCVNCQTRFPLITSYFHLRFWDATCARCVMRQGVRQKNTDCHRADMNSAGVQVKSTFLSKSWGRNLGWCY